MLNGAKRAYLSDLKAEDSEERFKDKTLSERRIPRSPRKTITSKSSRHAKGQARRGGKQQKKRGRGGERDRFVSFFPNPEESGENLGRIFQRLDHFAEYINDIISRVVHTIRTTLLHQRYFSSNWKGRDEFKKGGTPRLGGGKERTLASIYDS